MASYVLTPEFRVSYPNVFRAKKNDLSGKDEFGLVALFKKGESLAALETDLLRAAKEKWGDGQFVKGAPHKAGEFYYKTSKGSLPLRLPFRDQGEERLDKEGNKKDIPDSYTPGAKYLNLKSNQKPGLVDNKNQDIIEESIFYAGCYAKAAINAYAYDTKGNKGISFGLQALQKTRDGEPLSSRVKPQDAFQPIEDSSDTTGDAASLFG